MTRIIYDTRTGKTHPYPRADDAPIVGLDPALVVLTVIREPMPQPGEGFSITAAAPIDDLTAGTRTYGWITEKMPDPDPEPQWVAFGAAVLFHPAIRAFAAANPVDYPPLTLGFGQAGQGDTQTLMMLWPSLRQAGIITPELAAIVVDMAASHHLPAEFIAGLAA